MYYKKFIYSGAEKIELQWACGCLFARRMVRSCYKVSFSGQSKMLKMLISKPLTIRS
jgi:hypothetical protein